MEINFIKQAGKLVPCEDSDMEKFVSLKNGSIYKFKTTLYRNYGFHKKYFALINCAWEYQNENRRENLFKNSVDIFRKTVEITAGHCEKVYSTRLKEFIEVPKSISFSSMDNSEFQFLYDSVKDVLFSIFLKHISQDEFESNLINF